MKFRTLIISIALTAYLGLHNGNLALFRSGDPKPVQIYRLSVLTLPRKEQDALASGVRIRDNLHLAQLLENYLS